MSKYPERPRQTIVTYLRVGARASDSVAAARVARAGAGAGGRRRRALGHDVESSNVGMRDGGMEFQLRKSGGDFVRILYDERRGCDRAGK